MTLPWVLLIANHGLPKAAESRPLARAINVMAGELTNRAVAESFGMPYSKRFEV